MSSIAPSGSKAPATWIVCHRTAAEYSPDRAIDRRLNSGVVDVLLKTPDAEEELMAELGNLIRSYHVGARGQ